MNIHPAAEVFPMLPDDELQELAADIKENGLRESLKTSNGLLIDGRNRLAACKIAGVEPRMEELNGSTDPVAYIISENIWRRHLNKGQRAAVVAKIYPEHEKLGRGIKSKLSFDFTKQYLNKARTVLSVLPELADQVIEGVISLSEAYEKAQFERKANELGKSSLAFLRKNAPDLAQLVDEERMKLPEALAAYEKRQADERNQREAVYSYVEKQKLLIETLEGPRLENVIVTIKSHPEECSLTEVTNLADRFALGWHKLKEALQ